MVMRKTINNTDAQFVIMSNPDEKTMFPKGFRYLLGSTVYEVTDCFSADNTEWRRLQGSDGSQEEVTVSVILEDLSTALPVSKKGVVNSYSPEKSVKVLHNPYDPPKEPKPVAEESGKKTGRRKSNRPKASKVKKTSKTTAKRKSTSKRSKRKR